MPYKNVRRFPLIRITLEAKAHIDKVVEAANKSGQSASIVSEASAALLAIPLPTNGRDHGTDIPGEE
jgi:hypothetical protein